MKLNELFHLWRLPANIRAAVLRYTRKKMLGVTISDEERGANQVLRMLSTVDGSVQASGNDLEWTMKVNGQQIKVTTRLYPSSDVGILFQVLGKKDYSPVVEIGRSQNLTSGAALRIIDAGANVGFATLFFKAMFPKSEIVSLEIDSENFEKMKRNLSLNNLNGIDLRKNALWFENANLVVKRDFRDQTECSYYVEKTDGPGEIEGHDVFHYMAARNWDAVDILKIDIEGGERYIFDDAQKADAVLSKIKILAIEIHDEFNIRDTIYGHLKRNGFKYFNSGDLTIAHRA